MKLTLAESLALRDAVVGVRRRSPVALCERCDGRGGRGERCSTCCGFGVVSAHEPDAADVAAQLVYRDAIRRGVK